MVRLRLAWWWFASPWQARRVIACTSRRRALLGTLAWVQWRRHRSGAASRVQAPRAAQDAAGVDAAAHAIVDAAEQEAQRRRAREGSGEGWHSLCLPHERTRIHHRTLPPPPRATLPRFVGAG